MGIQETPSAPWVDEGHHRSVATRNGASNSPHGSREPALPGLVSLRAIVTVANPVLRHGLHSLLKASPNISHVAAVGDVSQTLELLMPGRFDMVITSASVTLNEYADLRETARRHETRLLLMLRESDRDEVARAVSVEADGYLIEEQLTPRVLDEKIQQVANGEMLMPNSLVRTLLSRSQELRGPQGTRGLTRRESHTLRLLMEGLSNKQIATKLGITDHGAKRHVANVLAKLNCANRTHAVALALREGLVENV